MKDKLSICERNRIVEENLGYIDMIINKNYPLMRAAHLEYDDVYQQLAIRLIKAVENFDSEKGELCQHIYAQLQFEILNCKAAGKRHGIRNAPSNAKGLVVSFDSLEPNTCSKALFQELDYVA